MRNENVTLTAQSDVFWFLSLFIGITIKKLPTRFRKSVRNIKVIGRVWAKGLGIDWGYKPKEAIGQIIEWMVGGEELPWELGWIPEEPIGGE